MSSGGVEGFNPRFGLLITTLVGVGTKNNFEVLAISRK
jgi:hypothetical protein